MKIQVPRPSVTFVLVGAIGFCVDGTILSWATAEGYGLATSRALSFSVAVLVTFILNRAFTFRSDRKRLSGLFVRYWLAQVVGACANFVLFLLLVHWIPEWKEMPILPLSLAAAAALVLTYGLSRLAFEGLKHEPAR